MTFKQQAVRILFGVEVIIVLGFYFFGAQGVMSFMYLKKELKVQEQILQALAVDIKNFEYDYDNWTNDSFYVEKHAREKLAMAREGEKIYVAK